jgi:hypothetical protein
MLACVLTMPMPMGYATTWMPASANWTLVEFAMARDRLAGMIAFPRANAIASAINLMPWGSAVAHASLT